MSRRISAVIRAGYWLALAVFLVDAGFVFSSLRTIAWNNSQIEQTRKVLAEVRRSLMLLTNAETGQRGYLLTERTDYLEPFRLAQVNLEGCLGRLKTYTSADLIQAPRFQNLEHLAWGKMAELQETLSLHDANQRDASIKVVTSGLGKEIMDQFRAIVEAMETEEKRRLDDRTATTRIAINRAISLFTLTTSAGLLLILLASTLNRREQTTRELAAAEIRRSDAWLATTVTSIGDALIATDASGSIRFLNPVALALTGWSSREAVGRPMDEVFRIINETTRLPVENPVSKVIKQGRIVGLANHTLLIAKDGREIPIDDSAAPIKTETGEIVGVVLVFRDVTEKHRQEAALRESEERFRQMADSIPHLAWIAREDGHIFWYNQRWYDYSGTTPDQMEGWGWQTLHDPEELPAVLRRWQESIVTGEPFDMVFPLKGADGEFRPFLTRVMPLKDEAGRVVQWFGTNTDISKERRAEAALRESERRFRQLADAMPQIVWTARPDGYLDYFNERWFEFSGLPRDKVGDAGWQPLLHPDDLPRCIEVWGEALRTGSPYQIEFRLHDRRTDRYRWHLVRALAARDDSGRVVRWYGTCTDIEDHKQIEEALRIAKDEAEEANKAKDQFLAVLSHELRTPLNPILLATTSMLETTPSPEEYRPNLEMIRQYVNLQARLIDDLLDVMRIVRGKMPLQWDVADAHDLIHQAIDICRSDILSKGHGVDRELSATHTHINTDPARLQQVFWNLIKNAVKFTPTGGTITIRTRNVEEPGGQAIRLIIEVHDTGMGIEPEILPRLFDHFQQGETTITRKFGGLGLGLAISKGIVDGHGGSITVESPGKDQGTTFRIELKALPEPQQVSKTPPKSHDDATLPCHPCRLLVVEDEHTTRRLMGRLLQGLGHNVTIADSVETAMREVEAEGFDLIISDIGLPDGSGLELMQRIVERRGPIPAIALTGYGMEEDIHRSRAAGFTAHMTKPIDFMKLEAIIRQLLNASNHKPPVTH